MDNLAILLFSRIRGNPGLPGVVILRKSVCLFGSLMLCRKTIDKISNRGQYFCTVMPSTFSNSETFLVTTVDLLTIAVAAM